MIFFVRLIVLVTGVLLSANVLASGFNVMVDPDPPLELKDFEPSESTNPFELDVPDDVIDKTVEYDPSSDSYQFSKKIGDQYLETPLDMSFEEYVKWKQEQQKKQYFNQLSNSERSPNNNDPVAKYEIKNSLLERLFGGNTIKIIPQGNVDVTLGGDFQRIDNPILTERQRTQGGFDFDMGIQMNVTGQIGEKLSIAANYNTQSTFDFENQMKLEYTGFEDDIIKKIEAGNVSFPLQSSLIQGNQSLFGFKTQLQFGRLTLTNVFSQQKSQRKNVTVEGGAQIQQFNISADRYDENRHFLLSHYNKDNFQRSLANLPNKNTLFKLTKMEVWITNDRNATEDVRDIVGIADLGEGTLTNMGASNASSFITAGPHPRDLVNNQVLPYIDANNIYSELTQSSRANLYRRLNTSVSTLESGPLGLEQSKDFVQVRARLLSPSEYSYDPDLGFISLNLTLQADQSLGVAYEYTYNGELYRVGEFTNDQAIDPDNLSVLFVKMLKSQTPRVDLPIWDLMMKNVYSLGAYQVSQEDFKLDVFYQDPGLGERRFLLDGQNVANVPLITLLNLDKLNSFGDPRADGVFDFINGVTIHPQNGRVMFPVLEPFGSNLRENFLPSEYTLADSTYIYQQLYDSTITIARQFAEFNRYLIKGSYKSSFSSDISLGAFNVPRGSVSVSAGGALLTEGVDYDVDYGIGRVRILNESLTNSGVPINVSFEDNALFSFQTKTLFGTRADFWINDNFTLGATYMSLRERPFTQKVNFGDDPINNKIYGFDFKYKNDFPFLTKILDKLPLYSTKEMSEIAVTGEIAYIDPGTSKVVNINGEPTIYIDDFEGSSNSIDLKNPSTAWALASTPRNDNANNNPLFPEASLTDSLDYGKNRALLNWYRIDNTVRNGGETTPYSRSINQQEVFPNIDLGVGQNPQIFTFDLTFYPDERGPYNFDVLPVPSLTAGISSSGRLNDPVSRWGGIQRALNTTDFEAANVEFVEMWVLSPFIDGAGGSGGDMYINLGNISEDVLKDSRNTFENGLPNSNNQNIRADTTKWGLVPRIQAVTNAFDNDPSVRNQQDVGLDGLDDNLERQFFGGYLSQLQGVLNPSAFSSFNQDPSGDNFLYYDDPSLSNTTDVLSRYRQFNNPQGNSQSSNGNQISSSTNIPDSEDLNRDNSLNQSENYFQYKIEFRRDPSNPNQLLQNPYITNSVTTVENQTWYQLRVPIAEFQSKVGSIQDFRSIQFVRMYLTGFEEQITFRFAKLELVRNQWRRFTRDLSEPVSIVNPSTTFGVSGVNIVENGSKEPFRYVLPPDIQREEAITQFSQALQNEQSLELDVCNLGDGDARGIFKSLNIDLRDFKNLKMFVHGETEDPFTESEDLKVFVRVGSDFNFNYYEYEIPLTITPLSSASIADLASYTDAVWPQANEIDFPLDYLVEAKIARNNANFRLDSLYVINDPDKPNNRISVIGNPDIGQSSQIMIGVKNPFNRGSSHCAKLWVNELRLSGVKNQGGGAGYTRVDFKLADLGTLTTSASFKGIGWGSLEQSISQRSRQQLVDFDASTNLNLDKFIPEKLGLKVPFYAQYSNQTKTPQFDPYSYDIKLKDALKGQSKSVKDSIKAQVQEVVELKSFNFTNVRKERLNPTRTPKAYDIENVSLSYSFTERDQRNPTIESDNRKDYRGLINYGFSAKPKYFEPFKDAEWKSKYLNLIKAIHLNPLPNGLSASTNLDRNISSITYRFSDPNNSTYYDKRFTWDRNYGLQWDIAKALNIDFKATNSSVIDEPAGLLDTQEKRDSIWSNIYKFGRTKNYTHAIAANYTLPLKQIPILDWINSRVQYGTDYTWSAAALNVDSLGNVLQNSQTWQLSGDLDFVKLYNKNDHLNTINRQSGKFKKVEKKTKDESSKPTSKDKNPKDVGLSTFDKVLLRPLMTIRKARFTYSRDYNSVVPGYNPPTAHLGLTTDFTAPGFGYILGQQPSTAWLDEAAANNWITRNIFLNQQVQNNFTEKFNTRFSLEPFADFKVDLDIDKSYTENHSEYFKVTDRQSGFKHLNPLDVGSLNLSFYSLKTMFAGKDANSLSLTFKEFEANRSVISKRLGQGTHSVDGQDYTDGFGRFQQDVLVPAFISAYTGRNPNNIALNVFDLLPMPNWKLNYNGLSKIPLFKEKFKSIAITHGYDSKFTINQYRTDQDFDSSDPFGLGNFNGNTGNLFSQYEIPDIVITEKLSPLIGFNVVMKNSLNARFDIKKSRTLGMSFTDYQLSETNTTELSFGTGYIFENVNLFKTKTKKKKTRDPNGIIQIGSGEAPVESSQGKDIDVKLDLSIRNDETINHLLDQNVNVPTRGLKTIRIAPSINYQVSDRLTMRFFYDYSRTVPVTSSSFPITNAQGGVTIRFSLQ